MILFWLTSYLTHRFKSSIPPPSSVYPSPSLSPQSILPGTKQYLGGLHIVGNRLENDRKEAVRLFGVNRSGTEYSCLHGGFSDGPTDQQSIKAIKKWNINTVRIPLNEDCWLQHKKVMLQGKSYQNHVIEYVTRITNEGMVAILDLHWNGINDEIADKQQPLPTKRSLEFWTSVASTFKNKDRVLFELFNEPDPLPYRSNYPGGFSKWQHDAFSCLLKGCKVVSQSGKPYDGVGMQALVDAVRNTEATNIVLVGGIQYAGTITQLRSTLTATPPGFLPSDPQHNLGIAMHLYNYSACSDERCWEDTIKPVATKQAIITTEFGDTNCSSVYTAKLLPWLDKQQISYIGWTWDTWKSCQALVTDYQGAPTYPYGYSYKLHLQQ